MNRRAPIWRVVALLFALLNIAAGVFAGIQGEPAHAGIHCGLAILSLYFVWRLSSQRVASY